MPPCLQRLDGGPAMQYASAFPGVRRTHVLSRTSADRASWHADYADSAYIYVGGLDTRLTEGDVITIFSQYGEPVDVHLPRDKKTGKSQGFAFIAYENQKSTNLAVDNLNGSKLLGRTLRVDHKKDYKPPTEEEEEGAGIEPDKDKPRKQIDVSQTAAEAAAAARSYPHLQKMFSDSHGGSLAAATGQTGGPGGGKLDPDEMWEARLARQMAREDGGSAHRDKKQDKKAKKAEKRAKKADKKAKKVEKKAKKAALNGGGEDREGSTNGRHDSSSDSDEEDNGSAVGGGSKAEAEKGNERGRGALSTQGPKMIQEEVKGVRGSDENERRRSRSPSASRRMNHRDSRHRRGSRSRSRSRSRNRLSLSV